jgi:lipopolysaccharide export LptBFGC system permease protein LptF
LSNSYSHILRLRNRSFQAAYRNGTLNWDFRRLGSSQVSRYNVDMSQIGDSAVNEDMKTAQPLDSSWRYTELWPKAKRKARDLSFTRMFVLPVIFGVFAIVAVMLAIWAIDILV